MIAESFFVRQMVYFSTKNVLLKPINQGHSSLKRQKRSENSKLELTGLHRDHMPALSISNEGFWTFPSS